jgi:hypothetical protein
LIFGRACADLTSILTDFGSGGTAHSSPSNLDATRKKARTSLVGETIMVSNTAEFRAAARPGHGVLKASAITWFTIAALGQFAFAAYIFAFYGGNALEGDWDAWTRRLIVGIVDGDFAGNLNVIAHMLLAFIICVGGRFNSFRQFARTLRASTAGMDACSR